jgi:hypothetical protein
MLRKIIHATLIVFLTTGAVSAQTQSLRTEEEKKNDKAIDRAYRSTIKILPDAEKKKSDPWGDVRPAPPPSAAKNKQ